MATLGNQRPQYGYQLCCRHMANGNYLGDKLIAVLVITRNGSDRILLGIDFRYNLDRRFTGYRRKAVHFQYGLKDFIDLVFGHALVGDNGDFAFYAWVDNKVLTGEFGHCADHGIDIRVGKIKLIALISGLASREGKRD